MTHSMYRLHTRQTIGGNGVLFVYRGHETNPVAFQQISKSGVPIILAEWLDDDRILIIDQLAFCSIFSLSKKQIIASKQLIKPTPVSAILLSNKKQISLLSADRFTPKKVLWVLGLEKFEVEHKQLLPPESDPNRMWQVSNEEIGVYFYPGGSLDKRTGDGLYRVNINTQKVKSGCFKYPSSCLFGASPLDISHQHKVGIRPRFDRVKVDSDGSNRTCDIRVRSLRIPLVSSGRSQKPSLAIWVSISCRRLILAGRSKITP